MVLGTRRPFSSCSTLHQARSLLEPCAIKNDADLGGAVVVAVSRIGIPRDPGQGTDTASRKPAAPRTLRSEVVDAVQSSGLAREPDGEALACQAKTHELPPRTDAARVADCSVPTISAVEPVAATG